MYLLVYHTAWNMPEYRLEETHILACFTQCQLLLTLSARKLPISYCFSNCLASDIPYYVLSISSLYCMDYSLPYRELLLHHDLHACKLFVICITHELFFNMTYHTLCMVPTSFYLFTFPSYMRKCHLFPAYTNTLSQRQMVGCIDVMSLLEMKFSPRSVENIVATLIIDVVSTLWQRYKAVTLQSALQCFFYIASTSLQLIFS